MATPRSIGSAATLLASFATLLFTLMGFSEINATYQSATSYSGQVFVGYAVVAWLGVLCLAFGWAGAAYSVVRNHFGLAMAGAVLILASCAVEYVILTYAPHSAIVSSLIVTWGPIILLQALFALAGIILTAKDRHQFT